MTDELLRDIKRAAYDAKVREMTDAEKHNYTRRTEAERAKRDELAVPASVKAERALQPADTRRCGCGVEMYEETTEPSSIDYSCEPIGRYWACPDCGEAIPATDTDEPKGTP
jgi:ribosome-binding ATPase YchF (GTP1/OBG family)